MIEKNKSFASPVVVPKSNLSEAIILIDNIKKRIKKLNLTLREFENFKTAITQMLDKQKKEDQELRVRPLLTEKEIEKLKENYFDEGGTAVERKTRDIRRNLDHIEMLKNQLNSVPAITAEIRKEIANLCLVLSQPLTLAEYYGIFHQLERSKDHECSFYEAPFSFHLNTRIESTSS